MEELLKYLQTNSWKEYPTCPPRQPERIHKLFCKSLPELIRCSYTENSSMQVCLDFIQFNIYGRLNNNVTVSMCGQVGNETWYALEAYSMSIECFIRTNEEVIDKLSKAWEALHGK